MRLAQLLRTFTVQTQSATADSRGRVKDTWSGSATLQGVLAQVSMRERLKFDQLGYPVSHTVLHKGPPLCRAGDRLALSDGRTFNVVAVENPADAGRWSVLRVEEKPAGA
jgi:head-tail adaptor